MAAKSPAATRLLTRHFLRRFFENDLISPYVDLHENTTMAIAALVSISLFVSVMKGSAYLIGFPPPGVVAVATTADNFMFLNVAMFAMALVAALQWDALTLDARDVANLGPLPIPRHVLVRAKLYALGIFACGFAVALNLLPSIIYQTFSVVKTPVGFPNLLRLIGAHALATVLASAFGFIVVIAIRELLRAVLGASWFSRVSTALQVALVLVFISALLLTLGGSGAVASWMHDDFPRWLGPPLWFMGLEQTLGGGAVANVTGVIVPERLMPAHVRALGAYRANVPLFREGAALAALATAAVVSVGAIAYAWNLRRLPQPVPASSRRRTLLSALGATGALGNSVRRAGLTFALQALYRSAPHRLSMAAAAALAIALSLALLERTEFRPAVHPSMLPASVLAVQTVFLTLLVAGFRRAVRLPAELKANWIMQVTWKGGERRFLAGVKLAAIVGIAAPVLLLLAPVHIWLLSTQVASTHLLIGACYSLALVEAFFFGCRKVPFASTYEPLSHVKTIGPIVFLLFLIFVHTFARIEQQALRSTAGVIYFSAVLAGTFVALRVIDSWRTRTPGGMTFDEPPEAATQWLGLSG